MIVGHVDHLIPVHFFTSPPGAGIMPNCCIVFISSILTRFDPPPPVRSPSLVRGRVRRVRYPEAL